MGRSRIDRVEGWGSLLTSPTRDPVTGSLDLDEAVDATKLCLLLTMYSQIRMGRNRLQIAYFRIDNSRTNLMDF